MIIEALAQSLIGEADSGTVASMAVTDAAFEAFASEYVTMSSRPLYGCKGCHGG